MKTNSWIKASGIIVVTLLIAAGNVRAGGTDPYGREDPNKKIIKNGLLGAGVGAISAGASGGSAGKGALIGAGTNVIGGALLDTLTAPPAQPQQAYYAPAPVQQPVAQQGYAQQGYVQQQPAYYGDPQPQPVYYQQPPPQEDPTKKILKNGLLGAGVGAISAGASGGKAGQGALIGAGTNVIGGALLDYLSTPSQPQQPAYYQQQQPQQQYYQQQQPQSYYGNQPQKATSAPKKKIIRKYDAEGNVISEEEVYE